MLTVENLSVSYDRALILNEVSLQVEQGELIGLVGPNGAGKSTLLRAITGLVLWEKQSQRGTRSGDITISGNVVFQGTSIHEMAAHHIVQRGLLLCPERRRPFKQMSVLDNLLAGAYLCPSKSETQQRLEQIYQLFPLFKDRSQQISGTLSGGEQQMLAIGRALMGKPTLLCIDEPSTGLSPLMRDEVFAAIAEVQKLDITILLVEQEVYSVFEMASRNYILSSGKIVASGTKHELLDDEIVKETYLGM